MGPYHSPPCITDGCQFLHAAAGSLIGDRNPRTRASHAASESVPSQGIVSEAERARSVAALTRGTAQAEP